MGPPGTIRIRIAGTIAETRVILAAMAARGTARLRVRIRDGHGPPSEQLRDGIQRQIERGALLPGDRLPPVRACAEDLELAPNTVARAYRALEDGGWLVGRGRAGTFVAEHLALVPEADDALARAADVYLRRAAQLGFDAADAQRTLRQRAR
jgi:DNA-binding transcriptional regulator YhcF (GntR family)